MTNSTGTSENKILGNKEERLNTRRLKVGITVLIFASCGAPVALADAIDSTTYTIHFTASAGFPGSGTLPTLGTFTYDPDTTTFTSFLVIWEGFVFDLTGGANAPFEGPNPNFQTPPSCIHGLTGAAASFSLLLGSCAPPPAGGNTYWRGRANFLGNGIADLQFFTDDSQFNELGIFAPLNFNQSPIVDFAIGDWTVTTADAPVPEPSALFLILTTPLPAAFLARKRIAREFLQATRTNRANAEASASAYAGIACEGGLEQGSICGSEPVER